MATKRTAPSNTKSRAKEVVESADDVRERVRELALSAFRDRNLSLSDVPGLVQEVLDGAAQGVNASIPQSRNSVLRQVFDGLNDGVHTIASAGSAAARDARKRGQEIADKALPAATKQVKAAQTDFLNAVKQFAGRTSKELREELNTLVARAQRTGSKVADTARVTAHAADGRLIELSGETARAGLNVVRRAAGGLAMATGGLLEGFAQAIAPKKAKVAEPAAKKKTPAKKTAKKKTAKVAKKSKAKGR